MTALPTVWFCAIALLWIGFLLLEGFDLGVGMHMLVSARNSTQRRVMLNTIGPFWDGNEVWLVTVIAGTFAAFPDWYAALLSTLYVPMTVILIALIFRAIGIEYRGKGASPAWARFWENAIGVGSFVIAFGVGATLALTTTGLPLDANGDRVGGPFAWLTLPAVIGGLAVVGFCLVHASSFLGLKADGAVRGTARRFVARWSLVALVPFVAWIATVLFNSGGAVSWGLAFVAILAGVFGWATGREGREGAAFIGFAAFLLLGVASIFAAQYPIVLPSTIAPANDLTVTNAASAPYTLGVMSVVAGLALPVVLVAQAWTYWVFRKRIGDQHIPAATAIRPAIRS